MMEHTDFVAEPAAGGRWRYGLFLLALAALGFIVTVLLINVLDRDQGEGPGLVFVIDEGSKSRVLPELESAVTIPTDIRFERGDTAKITIVNNDDVTHRAGPFLVAAGQTYVQRFDQPGSYPIACSVDPAESVVVTVEA